MIMPVRSKLFTGKTVAEELGEDFRNEIMDMMKQAAHDHNCDVEDLKFNVNSLGVVNIQNLTPEEIAERDKNG